MGVAAVLAVLVLFSPLVFLDGSDQTASPDQTSGPTEPDVNDDVVPAAVGYEFANPEHVRLRFTQDLTLVCQGLEIIDNGGFDSFDMDIWIHHQAGYARLSFAYPDGSTYDLILKGRPGAWEQAWGSGTDLGRNAGCREALEGGGFEQSIVGWAFQDSSELWFTAYLKPVSPENEGAFINHEGTPRQATATGPRTYVIEYPSTAGIEVRNEFNLDAAGIRVVGEQRRVDVPNQFDVNATIEVLETGPAPMPPGIFDTSTFTPLWGGRSTPTTETATS